jgi:PAS domain S-box-containing protein
MGNLTARLATSDGDDRGAGDTEADDKMRTSERSSDAGWRHAVMHALRDPLIILDTEGSVIEFNEAFTQLFGYEIADGPYKAPFPWWPTAAEDAESLAIIQGLHDEGLSRGDFDTEELLYTSDRRRIWVHTAGATVDHPLTGMSARIRVLRDITRDKQAQDRRAAAARISAYFATADDLVTLLAVAEHGFERLFDGYCTIQIDLEDRYLFSDGQRLTDEDLPASVAKGLAGTPSPDTASYRPGILLVPQTGTIGARAWVRFPRPRRISIEEMIAADLLAQAFGLAVDREIERQRSADKQANLEAAIESHRLVGQAVGILVERHRILAIEAFDRLKQASQNRNLKLRDLATRVIETGAEPDEA